MNRNLSSVVLLNLDIMDQVKIWLVVSTTTMITAKDDENKRIEQGKTQCDRCDYESYWKGSYFVKICDVFANGLDLFCEISIDSVEGFCLER